jgi:heme exporter protein B
MMRALVSIIRRDLSLALRVGGGAGIGLVFFLSVVIVVPFAVGPDLALLSRIGAAVLWAAALLAALLGLDRIFSADHEDGSLDLLLMSSLPLEIIAVAKGAAHWLATGLPLVIATPVFGVLLGVDGGALFKVALMLLIGTPAITFMGLIGAAIAVALPRAGMLVAVLILPFTIPVLIFGTAATAAAILGEAPYGTAFKLLCALTLFSFVIGPVAAAAALRLGRA